MRDDAAEQAATGEPSPGMQIAAVALGIKVTLRRRGGSATPTLELADSFLSAHLLLPLVGI